MCLKATVCGELISADMENTINKLIEKGILLYKVEYFDSATCIVTFSSRNLNNTVTLLNSLGCEFRIKENTGLNFRLKQFRHRILLLISLLIIFVLTLILPSKILFISVSGNRNVPSLQILTAAEESGIRFGVSRRAINSERSKNEIIALIPELQWVGINTTGCNAVISVIEKPVLEDMNPPISPNIVADRDGLILTITATAGNPQFIPGQMVLSGQVLISGYIDCGKTLLITQASGEVFAQTSRQLHSFLPFDYTERMMISEVKTRYNLVLGKKRINLWKGSGICPASCGRMYREFCVTLPGGFELPIKLSQEKIIYYKCVNTQKDVSEAVLSNMAETYLRKQMKAGTIIQKKEVFSSENGVCSLYGEYTCIEMIGQAQS